ncbi:aldo/keto reductase [Streptomyces sp. NPDC044780]|uniref:Aldo/keto reductase n=1 Tax=Streptomyces luomodiensis TaxID=3026192 RepID=A0ABY9UZ85_9ACTN|nr:MULTISPECIES: aldo/keto reductase [unclassified Streptomyces]WAP57342.1 aldo/keto reductase [Streptomyces sp. S465]WNE97902.1 aldo/keto reductase [Streptomyces sp. SCA4-21]
MADNKQKIGDLSVFPLSFGGNVFGWTANEAESFEVLDAYVAAGGNFIDTADVYSAWVPGNEGGESEIILGKWFASRGNRSDIVLATKVGAGVPEPRGLTSSAIKSGIEESLQRLGTDYIDLYYTHYDDPSVPVEEIITTLDELVREGKVREIGASNVSAERLEAQLTFSTQENLARYVALQPHYNLVSRDTFEGELADVAARHGLATLPYYSLASGFLTGKYRPGTAVDSPRSTGAAKYLETERGQKVLAALDDVAANHGAEPATVALAWLLAQPTVVAPIASARTVDQLPALLASVDLKLTQPELDLLTSASD